MNIQKYTEKAQEAIAGAQQLADREGHPEITPEHVLLTLDRAAGGHRPRDPAEDERRSGGGRATACGPRLAKNPRAHGGSQPALSARLRQVTNAAEAEAQRLKDDYVSTEHLLLALAGESGRNAPSARILQQAGADEGRHPPGADVGPRHRSASPRRIPRAPTSRSRNTAAT